MSIFITILLFILGACIGSFLHAWVIRLGKGESISKGRSKCVFCKKELLAKENIPLLSFLMLKGKCKYCKKKFSWSYFLTELSVAFGFVFIAFFFQFDLTLLEFWRDLIIFLFLVFIFLYDFKYMEIYDESTLYPAIALFIFSLLFSWRAWDDMCLGLLIGGGFFLLQFALSKGKWIGGGDIRLGVFMGVILGWKLTIMALLLSYVIGALFGIVLILMKKKDRASEVPFGTFLAVGTFITMFYGMNILNWYLGML